MDSNCSIQVKRQSLTRNYFFQFMYQVLILALPLVISPYLTRTLHETGLGIYAYVNSIAYYFVVIANLGIGTHGKRVISRNVHDVFALRKLFWSLFALHAIVSLIAFGTYLFWVARFVTSDKEIYLIEAMYVLSALFDITWLFYGLENFSSVVIRNTIVKIVECILIFTLVKNQRDLWKYVAISSGGLLAGQIVMFPQVVKALPPIRVGWKDIRQHMKPLLVFSIAVVSVTLYTVFDKTLLGLLSTKENVAFYEYSQKIIAVPQAFTGIIGTIMLPKACKLVVDGRWAEQEKYIGYSFWFNSFLGIGAMFGLFAVSKEFVRFYYGGAFSICGNIIKALSPLIYIIGTGSVLRSQCMIPNGMDRQFNLCIAFNALINLVLSTMLIPILGVYGAVGGTVAAEVFGLSYQIVLCRRLVRYRSMVESLIVFVVIGSIMYAAISIVSCRLPGTISGLMVEIAFGAGLYCILSFIYIYFFQKDIRDILLSKLQGALGKKN